mgnify:CR=1 FL=1
MLLLLPQQIGKFAWFSDAEESVTDFTARLTNFVIVEITPIGIQNLGWKFWIVFTVFNAFFLPVIYLFYPETCECPLLATISSLNLTFIANRTLEDMDDYYRNSPPLIVINDADVTSSTRPQKYIDKEREHLRNVNQEKGVVAHDESVGKV